MISPETGLQVVKSLCKKGDLANIFFDMDDVLDKNHF